MLLLISLTAKRQYRKKMIVSYQITIKKKIEYMRQKMIMSATNHKLSKKAF